jgi:hypothetical protein
MKSASRILTFLLSFPFLLGSLKAKTSLDEVLEQDAPARAQGSTFVVDFKVDAKRFWFIGPDSAGVLTVTRKQYPDSLEFVVIGETTQKIMDDYGRYYTGFFRFSSNSHSQNTSSFYFSHESNKKNGAIQQVRLFECNSGDGSTVERQYAVTLEAGSQSLAELQGAASLLGKVLGPDGMVVLPDEVSDFEISPLVDLVRGCATDTSWSGGSSIDFLAFILDLDPSSLREGEWNVKPFKYKSRDYWFEYRLRGVEEVDRQEAYHLQIKTYTLSPNKQGRLVPRKTSRFGEIDIYKNREGSIVYSKIRYGSVTLHLRPMRKN